MSTYSFDDSEERFPQLGPRQQVVFESTLADFKQYLRTKGKNPRREIGYAEGSIETRVSRALKAIRWVWETDGVATEITPQQADQVIEALDTDEFRRRNGDRYREGSKRKISNALVNWFRFNGSEWEPEITFNDEIAQDGADLFNKNEIQYITKPVS